MKKFVIFQNGGGELANQLWNYVSIFAYAKEAGAKLKNPSFFEYGSAFQIKQSPIADLLLFKPFAGYSKRRGAPRRKVWRNMYRFYVLYVRLVHQKKVLSSINSTNNVTYLPPTKDIAIEKDTIYFEGWLFRNPVGIEKYREDIKEYFKPKKYIVENVNKFLTPIANKNIIGVHIRQGDYKEFKNGKYFVDQSRVREILDEYIQTYNKEISDTHFVITSDGPVNPNIFSGLNYTVSEMSAVEDLFLLSQTDAVIGSDSSFGNFAAWYGDIPHIVFNKERMDWEYYKDKSSYFENKYVTMVHY